MSWVAANLLVSALLVGVVLLLRGPVARTFGAHAAYALWLAPLVRLVLPPIDWAGPAAVAADPAGAVEWIQLTTGRAAGSPAFPWLVAIWLAGAAAMLGLHLTAHARFLRRALGEGQAIARDGVDCDLVMTPAVDGPVATGLIHRLILVPTDFDRRFDPEQQSLALAHECLHHRRGDLWASAAALLVAALQWFNPLAHVALGAFRRDMESACDASLLARMGRAEAPRYAQTILRSAAAPVPRSLCALTSIDELKGRLIMLNATHGFGRRLAGLALAGGLAVGGLALSAPAAADEPAGRTKEVRTVIVEHDGHGGRMDGAHAEHMAMNCPGKKVEVDASPAGSADKKEVAKIVICSKGGTNEEAAKGLERALANVQGNSDMDPAVKADLTAKLQAKIAELRAGK